MLLSTKSSLTAAAIAAAASVSLAHLPSFNDASLIMGRTGITGTSTRADFSNKGEWKADVVYNGDYTIAQGDTVSYGEFNGKKLWWWAKFYAKGDHLTPGQFAPEGGTSPWVLINSLSAIATGTPASPDQYWRGWKGDLENSMNDMSAVVTTWRNGAVGAYSMTHDDIGAMPFDLSVQPGWDVAKQFPDIKQCWGVYVEKMTDSDWASAAKMVLEGHEMFNHSMRHTSAADQWQWFYPTMTVPTHDPAIPESVRGLTVVGTWGDPNQVQNWSPAPTEITIESDLVSIKCTPYWTQNAPSSEPVGTTIEIGTANVQVIEPVITAKSGVEQITLPSGQKQYVQYTKRDTTGQGFNEGKIAATGATWFEISQLEKYGENGWQTPSSDVTNDKGAPGFVAKVYCVKAWEGPDYKDNIQDASDSINKNLYEKIDVSGTHFRKGKRVEYYGYPFDAYSEVTHDSLEQNGFVGARGGAKSGRPIPGDFFHPYRIDFDAFYITETDWDPSKTGGAYTYPENPHVLLGANEMIDKIIEAKGYMIREFHAVADIADGAWFNNSVPSEQWPLNSAAEGQGGWWGGITKNQLKKHYEYIQSKIDNNEIVVYTVGEVTKYRMTANAAGTPSLTANGENYVLEVPTTEQIKDKYHEEITVMVKFDKGLEKFNMVYQNVDASWGETPRVTPIKMDSEGKIWAVSINPFLGKIDILSGQDYNEPIVALNDGNKDATSKASVEMIVKGNAIALNHLPAGSYKADIFSVTGRKLATTSFRSSGAVETKTEIATETLGKGMFILNVTSQAGASIHAQKLLLK